MKLLVRLWSGFSNFKMTKTLQKNPHSLNKNDLAPVPLRNCYNFGYKHSYHWSSYTAFSPLIPITRITREITYHAVNCTKGPTKIHKYISVFAPVESGSEKKHLWDGDWFWSAMALALNFNWPILLHEILQSSCIRICNKEIALCSLCNYIYCEISFHHPCSALLIFQMH